ncbi:MAG TPA: helix-turn-helix domain-containing protein [Solirubrobacteraceae bacterium]|jgi:TetR/AcrR family transcriptional repressor of nem operon|nr:helix-turn-helix domain-containing protein [Solirubrobacteraceae bacterium]
MAPLQPSTVKGQSTRRRIVQAAAELVAEKGAAGMSLDDVGQRAHASRSQLYHYFDDRDDLIRAMVDATTDSVLLAQDELLQHLDTWTGIDRWFRALIAFQEEREARGGCPIGSLVGQLAERDPLARAGLADGFERWEAHLRDGLERMQTRGRLSANADAATLATATMALLQGGLLLTQVRRDPKQLRTALGAARVLLRSAAA